MKKEYWLGVAIVAGAVVGYLSFQWAGLLTPLVGTIIGIVIGILAYLVFKKK